MPLPPGTKLGQHEINAPIGAGGMGEVYRARDTKLARDVAIKVLPDAFSEDLERLARFEREARLLASLNHPNIASIYGFESFQPGRSGGLFPRDTNEARARIPYLVLELVEGPTLAERMARGPIAFDEAVPIARQIASALEAGHEAGVVHRDLKPANVKLKEDGTVKVLDYGLAKALGDDGADADLSQSPTLTRQATVAGVILGTAAYMSPEQSKGKSVDARTDVWAFGVVLYEMLVGERLFSGETASDILAAVLRAELDWSKLPPETPEALRRLLRRCLSRDPAHRLPHIGAARLELEDAMTPSTEPNEDEAVERSRRWAPALAGTGMLGVLIGLALYGAFSDSSAPPRPIRASIDLPPGTQLAVGPAARSTMAVSRDGSTLAFVAAPIGSELDFGRDGSLLNQDTRIYVRRLDTGETTLLPDTEGAFHVFFSRDGRYLGFFADGELKKVALSGGAPVSLCPVGNPWGAVWMEDDRIVFFDATANGHGGLSVVSADGGESGVYSTPDSAGGDLDHSFPAPLPGSADLLITMWTETDYPNARVGWLPAGGDAVERLLEGGSHARVLSEGYLVYARSPRLLAAPFDAERGRLTGNPEVIVDDLLAEPLYLTPHFTVAPGGVLIWAVGGITEGGKLWRLMAQQDSLDLELLLDDVKIRSGQMFPGRNLIALDVTGRAGDDVYAYDADADNLRPVGTIGAVAVSAVPGPANNVIFYRSFSGVYRHDLTQQEPERLWDRPGIMNLSSVSGDGAYLAYTYVSEGRSVRDIGVADLASGDIGRPTIATPVRESGPMFSPAAPVIAYESNSTSRVEIWLQRFDPDEGVATGDAPVQVSRSGGHSPFWSPDGRTLYFTSASTNGDRLMAATVGTTEGLSATRPVVALELGRSLLEPHGIGRMRLFGQDAEGRFIGIGFPPGTVVTQLEAIFHWRPEGDEPQ